MAPLRVFPRQGSSPQPGLDKVDDGWAKFDLDCQDVISQGFEYYMFGKGQKNRPKAVLVAAVGLAGTAVAFGAAMVFSGQGAWGRSLDVAKGATSLEASSSTTFGFRAAMSVAAVGTVLVTGGLICAWGLLGRSPRSGSSGANLQPKAQAQDRKQPLLAVDSTDSSTATPRSSLSSSGSFSSLKRTIQDEESPASLPRRRLGAFGPRTTKKFIKQAEDCANGWAAALALSGVELVVNGELLDVRLKPPHWTKLQFRRKPEEVTDEPGAATEGLAERPRPIDKGCQDLPLVGLGFRIDHCRPTVLVLCAGPEANSGEEERIFNISLSSDTEALELALALKVLRASADTGCGIADWGDRPLDDLKRPPPIE